MGVGLTREQLKNAERRTAVAVRDCHNGDLFPPEVRASLSVHFASDVPCRVGDELLASSKADGKIRIMRGHEVLGECDEKQAEQLMRAFDEVDVSDVDLVVTDFDEDFNQATLRLKPEGE